jgi:hypothetical protein
MEIMSETFQTMATQEGPVTVQFDQSLLAINSTMAVVMPDMGIISNKFDDYVKGTTGNDTIGLSPYSAFQIRFNRIPSYAYDVIKAALGHSATTEIVIAFAIESSTHSVGFDIPWVATCNMPSGTSSDGQQTGE